MIKLDFITLYDITCHMQMNYLENHSITSGKGMQGALAHPKFWVVGKIFISKIFDHLGLKIHGFAETEGQN